MSASEPVFDFSDTKVLVTGGTSGIGLGIAEAFCGAGAEVMITGRRVSSTDYEDADRLAAFRYESLEMRDSDGIETLVESLDSLDVLINNAGGNFPDGLDEATPEGFDASLEMNLMGAHRLTRGLFPRLKSSGMLGGGNVINVISMSAFRPAKIVPGYATAKAALLHLTRQLALTWAGDGIRVNSVAPGLVETNLTAPMKGMEEIEGPELAKVPMARWGQPDDVSGAVLFLAGPGARFITGQNLCVDGGYSLT